MKHIYYEQTRMTKSEKEKKIQYTKYTNEQRLSMKSCCFVVLRPR